ncbi:MAG: hypothetical protein ABI634_14030 [Acidobacteriota bacterium]
MDLQQFVLTLLGATNYLTPIARPSDVIAAVVAVVPNDLLPAGLDGTVITRERLIELVIQARDPQHPYWQASAATEAGEPQVELSHETEPATPEAPSSPAEPAVDAGTESGDASPSAPSAEE